MTMPDWCETEEWCPVTVTAELMGRKWNPVIIHRLLQEEGKGFNQLKRECHGISAKVLNDSLEQLQEREIVSKEIISQEPKKVSYTLTPRGKSLEPVVSSMKDWAEEMKEEF